MGRACWIIWGTGCGAPDMTKLRRGVITGSWRSMATVKETAEFAAVSASTIRREVANGNLRSVKVRGAVRILRVDLFTYLGMEPENEPARNWDAELLEKENGNDSHGA